MNLARVLLKGCDYVPNNTALLNSMNDTKTLRPFETKCFQNEVKLPIKEQQVCVGD